LGRKSGAKNYRYVIDAVREVNNAQKICDLLIIGRDEDGVPIDPADACYLGEQPRGIVLAALKQCLCLVTMSGSESFGIVVLEAWVQSRPVIVTSTSVAYSELVDDGQNGLLATKESLASKITFLLNHTEQARRMGVAGYRKAEKVFSWSAISYRLLTLFRELIDSNTGRRAANPDHTYRETVPAL
jgi:glycosyltransferase involved in cell wall biosynthesis